MKQLTQPAPIVGRAELQPALTPPRICRRHEHRGESRATTPRTASAHIGRGSCFGAFAICGKTVSAATSKGGVSSGANAKCIIAGEPVV